MSKKWKCAVCGQIFEGEQPPVPCPVCGAGEEAFTCLDAPASNQWKCAVCGQVFDGEQPPVPCPVCGAGEEAFEPVVRQEQAFRRDSLERFVVVGGGVAGLEAVKAIRRCNHTAKITLVCGEGMIPYNRPALSDVVGDGYSFEAIALEEYGYYQKNDIQLVCDGRVESVDAQERVVRLSGGRTLGYDRLLLATGANPFNPIKAAPEGVPVVALRSYWDAMEIVEKAPGKRVIVVGGGILGLEAAVALRERGCQVTVVELGETILSIQADAEVSGRLKGDLEKLGIGILTGRSVQEVTAGGAALTDGSFLPAELVLVSIGVRSEVTLARQLGLAVNRGIVVDEHMQTSQPDIYAAGDCAEFQGRVAGLWPAASAQGQVAGANMAGDDQAYAPMAPATAFEARGISLFAAGSVGGGKLTTVVWSDERTGGYLKLAFRDKRLVGVLSYARPVHSGRAVALVERGAELKEAVSLL